MSASLDYLTSADFSALYDTARGRRDVDPDTALVRPGEEVAFDRHRARPAAPKTGRDAGSVQPVTRIDPTVPDTTASIGARTAPAADFTTPDFTPPVADLAAPSERSWPSGYTETDTDTDTATGRPDTAAAPSGDRWPPSDRSVRVGALLAELAACQDAVERRRLQSAVVVEHLSVAKSIASRYRGRGVERGDLEQLAYLGLVKAASRWLPGLSDDFLQFAVPTISGEIKRYFRDHSWLVRPPRRIQELRAAISVAERDLQDSGQTRPTDELVGARLGVSGGEVREARAAAGLCRPPSIDADSGAGMFIAQQWSGDDCTAAIDDRMSLDVLMGTLSERERTVLGMRYGDGLSQARIGELIGVSQMQVSRILRDVLAKLRDRWEA